MNKWTIIAIVGITCLIAVAVALIVKSQFPLYDLGR